MSDDIKSKAKAVAAHAGTAGGSSIATVIVVLQLLNPQLETAANERAQNRAKVDSVEQAYHNDTRKLSSDLSEIKGYLKAWATREGVKPEPDSTVVETVFVPTTPDSSDSN